MVASTRMFRAAGRPARGVVLVTHGLNNKPDVMNPLIKVLTAANFHCLRVSLHRETDTEVRSSTAVAQDWAARIADAYADLSVRYRDRPIHCLAYSLGALVTMRFLQEDHTACFSRMVLLAPSLALRKGAALVRYLAPLSGLGLALPSLAPEETRARSATPLAEYEAMLKMLDAVQRLESAENLRRIPTKIFLSPQDELVSYDGVASWVETNGLRTWSLEALDVQPLHHRAYKHLVVSRQSLGNASWRGLAKAIVRHFESPEPGYPFDQSKS